MPAKGRLQPLHSRLPPVSTFILNSKENDRRMKPIDPKQITWMNIFTLENIFQKLSVILYCWMKRTSFFYCSKIGLIRDITLIYVIFVWRYGNSLLLAQLQSIKEHLTQYLNMYSTTHCSTYHFLLCRIISSIWNNMGDNLGKSGDQQWRNNWWSSRWTDMYWGCDFFYYIQDENER